MDILRNIIQQAKAVQGTVVFGEGDEARTLAAAVRLSNEGICKAAVVAQQISAVEKTAAEKQLDIGGLEVLVPATDLLDDDVLLSFIEGRKLKGIDERAAVSMALEPLYFSSLYVKSGKATSFVGGARADTSDVLRSVIYGIGTMKGVKAISSFFLMIPPADHPVAKRPLVFADCAVNPDPGPAMLRDIAVASVHSFKCLFPGERARVAFLSFSTRGSAEHVSLEKIRQAVQATREHFSKDAAVDIDGEFQFDAAVLPSIAERKAKDSPIRGDANILIFPDLNAGNIGYKITERYGLFEAVGPVLQGAALPASDLSRGCSVEDIYHVAAVTLLQSRCPAPAS